MSRTDLSLVHSARVVRHLNSQAGGTTPVAGSAIDMAAGPFSGVCFSVLMGVVSGGAVTSAVAQQSPTGTGSWSALAGTEVSISALDDDQIVQIEVLQPKERYVRCFVNRATANAEIDGIMAQLHSGPKEPAVQLASETPGTVVVVSPEEAS